MPKMSNREFNQTIKLAFDHTPIDSELSEIIGTIWIANNTTELQNEKCNEIVSDIEQGLASCSERYYLPETL